MINLSYKKMVKTKKEINNGNETDKSLPEKKKVCKWNKEGDLVTSYEIQFKIDSWLKKTNLSVPQMVYFIVLL